MTKHILLNPGPVNLSDRVRNALLRPDLCHREQEFIDLQNSIREKLLDVYGLSNNDWAAILMTGSGTAAIEAMLTSFVPAHGKVLIIENGVYGERLTKIVNAHQIDHVVLHHEWEEEINLKRLEDELQYHKELTHVAVVHHETTTGRLNQPEEIAKICQRYKLPILMDGVSSFGAEDIKFKEWNIAACAATANKCLHAVPGTAFVIVNRNALEIMQATSARTLYLDLVNYLKSQDAGGTPFTQSIQTFYALDEALNEVKDEGGQQQRQQDYLQRMEVIREGLINLGVQPLLKKEDCSCVLNAFHLPDGMTYKHLHDQLKEKGFVIYAGQGGLVKSLFRVSCMGDINIDDMKRLISSFEEILG
jgi:2-aminoethylphosphonate-pyruvate transaminase